MRMLLSLVMMVVVVVVVVESDVPPDSHLYSECAVKKNGEITTFEDSVKFWFVKTSDKDLKITFDQEATYAFTMQYENIARHEWLQAELKFRGAPELYIQGSLHRPTISSYYIATRKTFTIEDADILLQCPQGWPNRQLSGYGGPDVRIPSSGKEESLVLTSVFDTKVSFSVSGNMRTLCWNTSGSGLAVVDGETESDCGDLRRNSPVILKFLFEDHNVEVLDAEGRHLDNLTYQGVRDLKFLWESVFGPVHIAQCIGNCSTDTAQGATLPIENITTRPTELREGGPDDSSPGYDSLWLISASIFFIVLIAFDALIIAFVCTIFKKL